MGKGGDPNSGINLKNIFRKSCGKTMKEMFADVKDGHVRLEKEKRKKRIRRRLSVPIQYSTTLEKNRQDISPSF